MRTARVADKTTFTSRMQAMYVSTRLSDAAGVPPAKASGGATADGGDMTIAEATAQPAAPRQAKENLADYIAKKREIFLVQMSLDTKRAEIKKLEERARQREEALRKSERMLEEDALRFDAFLKENDEKVQEALKRAEHEAKLRHDRASEIKRLNGLTAVLKSEMGKYEEQLEDCGRYRAFLDSITPVEHFEERARRVAKKRAEALGAWEAACAAVRKEKSDAVAAKEQAEHDYEFARTQQAADRAQRAIKDSAKALKATLTLTEPPMPDLDALAAAEGKGTLFFQRPEQLLHVYHELEETNLFLIQNAQEAEEALEEVRLAYAETRGHMDATVAGLQAQIAGLEAQIDAAKDRTSRLQQQTADSAGGLTLGIGDAPHIPYDQLTARVAEVFVRAGFDADASLTSVQMLANMELRLEEWLAAAAAMPLEHVVEAEKARNKERRSIARDKKMDDAKRDHEARAHRDRERAAAPVFKKVGKPVMFRSQPAKKRVVVVDDPNAVEEAELAAFLAREML